MVEVIDYFLSGVIGVGILPLAAYGLIWLDILLLKIDAVREKEKKE